MTDLKPCPFCGGVAEISQGRFDGKYTSYVICRRCAARGEYFVVSPKYASNEKAIKAWNTRYKIEENEKDDGRQEGEKDEKI